MIKALLLDLDNTIYPAKSISHELFAHIEHLMDEYRGNMNDEELQAAIDELSSTPFQKVVDKHDFKPGLKEKGIEILKEVTYDKPITAYKDYAVLKAIPLPKYLVTFGFVKLQQSKVDGLDIRSDFKEVIVVDPESNGKTKKQVFEEIMNKNGYQPDELLVVGDDPESEIKAGIELGMPTYLYDAESRQKTGNVTYHEQNYDKLKWLIENQQD